MPTPDEDYRLRELERRLSIMETTGSAPLQRIEERLNNERDVRRETAASLAAKLNETAVTLDHRLDQIDASLKKEIDELRNTQTWAFRLVIGSVLLVAVGVLVAVLSGGVT